MTKEEFFKKNDEKFLKFGFKKDKEDPMFYYEKNMVSDELIESMDLDITDVPKILFGDTGVNSGFCIYTGYHFVWFNATTPEDAIEFASKILAVEEC